MGVQSKLGRLTRRERILYAALRRIANIGSDNPNRIYGSLLATIVSGRFTMRSTYSVRQSRLPNRPCKRLTLMHNALGLPASRK
jgi:hypothetical protein